MSELSTPPHILVYLFLLSSGPEGVIQSDRDPYLRTSPSSSTYGVMGKQKGRILHAAVVFV